MVKYEFLVINEIHIAYVHVRSSSIVLKSSLNIEYICEISESICFGLLVNVKLAPNALGAVRTMSSNMHS